MKKKYWLFLLLVLGLNSNKEVFAQGDLMVYPTRLVFHGKQDRIQIINLNNIGKDTTTYNLSYIENEMLENGHLEILEKPFPGQKIASPNLRFYPRTITLAPGETQVVKIQLVNTNELTRGEYRSHLYFKPIPKPEELETRSKVTSEGISISLKPIYGVSIANIIRIKDPESHISISEVIFNRGAKNTFFLSMKFNRDGDASSYGDISLFHISPQGKRTTVAEKKGFAVYTPGTVRKENMELEAIDGVNYSAGKLKVQYTTQGADKQVIAEKTLEL